MWFKQYKKTALEQGWTKTLAKDKPKPVKTENIDSHAWRVITKKRI